MAELSANQKQIVEHLSSGKPIHIVVDLFPAMGRVITDDDELKVTSDDLFHLRQLGIVFPTYCLISGIGYLVLELSEVSHVE